MIRLLNEARIVFGAAEIHIAESEDGIYNIRITEYRKDTVRIGIPRGDKGSIHFKFLDEALRTEDGCRPDGSCRQHLR